MAKGTVNKVTLIGRLGADPEVRYMPSGSAVANLRLATNEGYKDKQTGQFVENTEWHRVVCFGRLGEIAGEYLRKGRLVYVEGRLRTNKWQDQSGADRYSTEIVANDMQLLGGRDDAGAGEGFGASGSRSRAPEAAMAGAQESALAGADVASPPSAGFDQDFDDEIPF